MALAAFDLAQGFPSGQLVAAAAMAERRDRTRHAPGPKLRPHGKAPRGAVKAVRMSRQERRLLAIVQGIGEPLLRSSARLSLKGRLERASMDPALNRAVRALTASIDLGSLLSLSLDPVATNLTPRLGEAAAAAIVQGMRYELAAVAASMNFLALVPSEHLKAFPGASLRGGRRGADAATEYIDGLVYAPSLPLTASETLAAVRRANAAMMGILFALMSGRRLAHDLAAELARVYADGMHGYIRLIASIPAFAVSEEIVPASERYDIPALERVHAEFWHGVATGQRSFGTPDDDA